MLYLIQVSDLETSQRLLKIGYSDNWKKRQLHYILSNPLTKFLGEREGDEVLEKLFHLRFKEFSYSGAGREWFLYNSEIIEGFRNFTESDLLDWLWNNRLKVLDRNYFREEKSIQYQIVEKLYTGRQLDWMNKFDNIWDRKLCKERVFDIRNDLQEVYSEFEEEFTSETIFEKKMKLYCDFLNLYQELIKTTDLPCVPREFQNYVNLLGTKRIKALEYRQNECENEYRIITSQDQFKSYILNLFQVSQILPLGEIKFKLQGIYDSLGVKKKAKATDLGEYFEIESTYTNLNNGKRSRALKLLKIKY